MGGGPTGPFKNPTMDLSPRGIKISLQLSIGERRLAAIMFTDMVGFTTLGQENESTALELLERHRQLLRPLFSKHAGHEIKTMADAFLVEFASALEATLCAIDIQNTIHSRNLERGEKLQVRIGIHVGDVVHQGGDVLGDAVNVASRIVPLAAPGGICISEQVQDHIKNKISYPLAKLEATRLKNLVEPIDVYQVVLPWGRKEIDSKVAPQLDRHRIAVLPFANMSPDPNEDYFADGMTEELISTLSGISGISVISRTSVMMFKKNPKPAREIAADLEAGTLLEGSVRKAGNKVRITVQMIDSKADRPVWSRSYDRNLDDVFSIQSDISQTVADQLKIQLLPTEKQNLLRVPTTNTEAHTLYMKGRHFVNERGTVQSPKDAFYKAIDYFEQATKRDPHYAAAYAGLSDCYQLLGNWGLLQSEVAVQKGMEYAVKALELDDSLAEAHTSMAVALSNQKWDWEGAEREYKRALTLNPSYSTAHHWYAIHLLVPQRRWDEGVKEMKEAEKLDPFSSIIAANTGIALFYAGRHQEGIGQLRQVLEMDPDSAYAHVNLGTFLVSASFIEEGTAEIERALVIRPGEPQFKPSQAYAYMAAGRKPDAEKVLAELIEASNTQHVPATLFAEVYATLGLENLAFEWLRKAVEKRESTLFGVVNDPMFDRLRADPRFRDILNEIGLE
jgi:TolB-like protein/class 3 adenylate cyclase/Tfp pilus assembly protein PilF